MKILHINCNYLGSALHQNMVEHLNVTSKVFVPVFRGFNGNVVKPNDNVTVAACFNKWDRLVFHHKQKKIISALQEKIIVKEYDILHAYTLFTDGNVAYQMKKKYGIPYVVAIRNTDVNVFLKKMIHLRKLAIRILRNASAIFFLSETYKDFVFEKYLPQSVIDEIGKKTFIVPNGIDDFWLDNHFEVPFEKTVDKDVKLVYAGRIDKNKNITLTQRAMDILRKEGIECSLTVVGWVENNKVLSQIKRNSYTKIIGAKPKEDLINIYRDNDIFVMPSHYETFGLVYSEAMSQGLPVIYTKGQGFDKQFAEGEVGFHVSDTSSKDVAEAIKRIINDHNGISKRCTKLSQKFNLNDICDFYLNLYMVLGEHRRTV